VAVEFVASEGQVFELLQRRSHIRCDDGVIQTYAVQEDARKGKTLSIIIASILVTKNFLVYMYTLSGKFRHNFVIMDANHPETSI